MNQKFGFPAPFLIHCKMRQCLQVAAVIELSNAPQQHQATSQFDTASRNVLKTLIIVCCCFVLCWVWNQMYFFTFSAAGNTTSSKDLSRMSSKLNIGWSSYLYTTLCGLNSPVSVSPVRQFDRFVVVKAA